jgi:type IV secretory pathway VirB2 component (pilin)
MRIKNFTPLLIVLLMTAASVFLQAQELVPQGLQTMAENVRDIFTGDLAKIILGCCFAGSCIAYGYNKDNEKMKAKLLAVVIATGLLCITQQIMDKLWTMS